MKRGLWIVLGAALAGVIALAFVFPHAMVSPGNLKPAHAALQANCFACHEPFRGASPQRCIACHAIFDIGRRTTSGVPIVGRRPPFHQALVDQNCMACHSDHPRPRLARTTNLSFAHAMLLPEVRRQCAACHTVPTDAQHNGQDLPCAQCHQTRGWTPATFDHDRYFRFDSNHRVACVTCHVGRNYHRATCYGCHEHQADQIRAKHLEEGITNIDNCARCHQSPSSEPGEDGKDDD